METHRLCVERIWVQLLRLQPLFPRLVRTLEPAEDLLVHCGKLTFIYLYALC